MTRHKFKVGQQVAFVGKDALPARGGLYKVVRQLPVENGESTYRIKSADETYERVARESQLAAN